LDLSGLSNVQLEYWYEKGGNSEPPDGVNDLVFEYWDGSAWREISRHYGTDPDTTNFTKVTKILPLAALHAQFKLRIRALSDSGPNDYWFIDNISITAAGSVGINSTETDPENPTDAGQFAPGFRLNNLPAMPADIPPNGSVTFDVTCDPCELKEYKAKLIIESEDINKSKIELLLTGRGIPDYLSAAPEANQGFSGHFGGPYMPSYNYYYLNNEGSSQMNWMATADVNWLTISPASGIVLPSAQNAINVNVNPAADSLPIGDYNGTITFTNTTTGKVHRRTVNLNIYNDPKISIQPGSINIVVRQDQNATEHLMISNSGSGTLNFAISCKQTGFTSQQELENGINGVNTEKETDDIALLDSAKFAPGRILVRFKSEDGNEQQQILAEKRQSLLDKTGGGRIKKEFQALKGLCMVELPQGADIKTALKQLRKEKEILYAEPDYEVFALETGQMIPNDSSFSMQWNMHNTGQTGGTVGADINAPEAWDIAKNTSNPVVIAVIDTGVQYTHPDIAANMWVNMAEKNGLPGVDDDGNGYIDDIYGYDFCTSGKTRDSDPMDDHGHGTHCAGVIGAVTNNNLGVAGVCWNAKIMAIKFLNSSGGGVTSDAIDCIGYAVKMGAKVMSNSWGGGSFSQALADAIEAANQAGVLFVAAAGNSAVNTDTSPNYPSGYPSQNIIAVLATNYMDNMSSYSNWGLTSVDIGAPGGDSSSPVYSCYIGSSYTNMSGTSMACPHVAGACGLVISMCPNISHLEVKNLVMNTADKLPVLNGKCVSGGRLDLQKAVSAVQGLCNAPWISIIPSSGQVSAGNSKDVNVIFNGNRPAGVYMGYIKVTSNDPSAGESYVPINLKVEKADYFTQLFDPCQPIDPCDPNCIDLAYHKIMFFPDGSVNHYRTAIKDVNAFTFDPAGGNVLNLDDDDYMPIDLGGKTIEFYGEKYDRLYVGSNGYITFESGDIARAESLQNHFALPRISALFDDLDPSTGGAISYILLDDRLVITFKDVPEFSSSNTNSFQVELLFDGKIALTLLNISAKSGLVGLSQGAGIPNYFQETDFTGCRYSGPTADFDDDMEVNGYDYAMFAQSWLLKYELINMQTATDAFTYISYGNNNGTVNFTGNWIESGESDGPMAGLLQIVYYPYRSMRLGSNTPNVFPVSSLTRGVNLTGAKSATLSYYYTVGSPAYTGTVTVEVSRDGNDWTSVASYNTSSGYGFAEIDISSFISPTTKIRFKTSSRIRMYLYIEYLEVRFDIGSSYKPCDFDKDLDVDVYDLMTFSQQWMK
jgi:subtilisin family serine protease